MARAEFIARADDLGSSLSANAAIDKVSRGGFIKNVSVMAPGPFVSQAAERLAGRRALCFGMHTTLNAEWDRVKWRPVLPLEADSGLVDEKGFFLSDPELFEETKPSVETIMLEVNAQLERLHALGFDIRYIDSHMFPEMHIAGMDEAMRDFARQKGLIDHMHFYKLPPGFAELGRGANMLRYLRNLPAGQYFYVAHPSLYTQEMLQTGNARYSGEEIARSRAEETKMLSGRALRIALRLSDCGSLRYDEAKMFERLSVSDLKALLGG